MWQSEPAVIWTHDRNVRGMGLFLILRHKLLCIPSFKEILHCKGVCEVNLRIDRCLSHHGGESKSQLVLTTLRISLGRQKQHFAVRLSNIFAFGGEINTGIVD